MNLIEMKLDLFIADEIATEWIDLRRIDLIVKLLNKICYLNTFICIFSQSFIPKQKLKLNYGVNCFASLEWQYWYGDDSMAHVYFVA